jgi:molybdate transport system regulatory protein
MKVSVRKVFEGRLSALVAGPVNAEVTLTLAGGDLFVAVVTHASVRDLGLAVGASACAVVEAPWVVVSTGGGARRL